MLLALSCTLHPVAADDKESMEDVHTDPPTVPTTELPEVTTVLPTVLPEVVSENVATAIPDVGLQAADGGRALVESSSVTLPPLEASTVVLAEKPLEYPYVHTDLHTHLHPFPQPYPGFEYTSKVKPGALGYGYPSYPVLRTPYSPYGLPHFHHQYPGYSAEAGYGNPYLREATPDSKSAEKPESDEKVKASETEKKPAAEEGLGLNSGVAVVAEGSKVVPTVPEKPVGYPTPFPQPYSGFGYPVVRPSYSPYGPPHFHHQFAGGYGSTFPQETQLDEKPSSEEKEKSIGTEKIPGEAAFGYTNVIAAPRFRYLPRYPYVNRTPYNY